MLPFVPSAVQDARVQLVQRRDEIRAMHGAGATGSQVAAALTVLVDGIVARLAAAAIEELGDKDRAAFESGIALVAIGGYGRAELAPYSDVDLMFLYQPAAQSVVQTLCDRLVRDFWDARLALGSSMRTLTECQALSSRDVSVHTALLESRHVVGNALLTHELRGRIARLTAGRRAGRFIDQAVASRSAEQAKCGSTVYLLEPDIKRSKGGLRELHLQRWVAQVRHGVAAIDALERGGLISIEDGDTLRAAREFLLRVRNDLHFQAGRAQDILAWDEQVRLARAFGYQDRPGMLAVEQFMQQYYQHSAALDELTDRFVRGCRPPAWWRRLARFVTSQQVPGDYRIRDGRIAPAAAAVPTVVSSLERIVDLFTAANRRRVPVADELREHLRLSPAPIDSADAARARHKFLAMLAEPGFLCDTLHQMHSVNVLEKLIPEFAHARGLIQYNQYHKFTVDEHTLLCLANVEKLLHDQGPLGQVYRDIRHREILHLALLLHDLGKGFDRDHSELGREFAAATAERFGLEPHLRDILTFLVHQHLLMAHLAFRRDTSDERLLARFARQVGTPEVLKMLFVLTAADIASVGPETWTTWKEELLSDLYARTMLKLSGDVPALHPEQLAHDVRAQVARSLAGAVPPDWLDKQLDMATESYLRTTPPERIADQLRHIHSLPDNQVVVTSLYDAQTQITAYTVYTFDSITRGLFAKIAGVLAAKGLQILGAQIATFKDGIVVDRFEVLDYDYTGAPPSYRLADVAATIQDVLRGSRSIESLFIHSSRIGPRYQNPATLLREPTQVKIDNDTSDHFTIIEVFANDRQGLLYVITRTIFELDLSVSLAKIATSLDQVLDVFYVSDASGRKVTDEAALSWIQSRLVSAIEAFESQPQPGIAG